MYTRTLSLFLCKQKKRLEKTIALIDVVMQEATGFLDCEGVTLFIVDHASETLWSNSRQYESIKELTLSFDEGPVGQVVKTGKGCNVST